MHQFDHLGALFDLAWREHGPNPFIGTLKGDRYHYITYDDFFENVRRVQSALALKPGDVVALIANNSEQWATIAFAALYSGAAVCPMYEAQQAKDWRFICADARATVAVCATKSIADELDPHLAKVILIGEGETYRQLLEAEPAQGLAINPDSLAFLLYTSGTTAEPKGVPLTHRNVCTSLNNTHPFFEFSSTDRSLSFLPWAHSFGLIAELFTLTAFGASLALAQSVATIITDLAIAKPTILFSVPRVFTQFYNAMQKKAIAEGPMAKKVFDAAVSAEQKRSIFASARRAMIDKRVIAKVREKLGGQLKFAFSGAAALSPEVAQFMMRLGVEVYEGYGLTETSALVACNRPGDFRIGTVGKPVPNIYMELAEVSGQPDGVGEIIVKGDNVMAGYHNLPPDPEVIDADGYFHTGDLGRFDQDGFLSIVGRKKEQYKLSTGKYVVPAPLEEVLAESPLVQHVILVGENRPYNVALVTVDPDYDSESERAEFPFAVLASFEELTQGFKTFELPKKVVVLHQRFSTDQETLTPSGKPKRRTILETYAKMIKQTFEEF